MHTEKEARETWCSADVHELCSASSCMAWRWLRMSPIRGVTVEAEAETGIMVDGNGSRIGYCGLAGKP